MEKTIDLGKALISTKKLVRLPDKVLSALEIEINKYQGEVLSFSLNDNKVTIRRL